MSEQSSIFALPLHLGKGGTATVLTPMTGMEWYEDYAKATAVDGADGRLVSAFHFTQSWDSWEMHPAGDEIVICLSGSMTLIQEFADGSSGHVTISAGEFAINPPGCWHTADIEGEASALFITAGMGTDHRPR
jgi:mannose-6-phosphate isomerase-like protein (cupin superfamily)